MKRLRTISLHRPIAMLLMLLAVFAFISVMAAPVRADKLPDPPPTASSTPTPWNLFQSLFPNKAPTATEEPESRGMGLLTNPPDYSFLSSSRNLDLLAGELIFRGLVDASSCADGGLLKSHAASPCGARVAHNAVILWQNQFDEAIYNAAAQENVPPYLLKNIIIQESQFWPGSHPVKGSYSEYGLGHMTGMGADTLLRWNSNFSKTFCPQIFSKETCSTDYPLMPSEQQAILRGAVIQHVNADCGSCPGGIDLQRARDSILFIAATLRASQNSAAYYITGLTGRSFTSLDGSDAWRISMIAYHGGPGCLSSTVSRAKAQRLQPNWKNLSASLDKDCESSEAYVQSVKTVQLATTQELIAAQFDNSKASKIVYAGLGWGAPPVRITDVPPASATPSTPASSPTGTAVPDTGTESPTPTIDLSITPTETSTPDPSITETATPTFDPSVTVTVTSTLESSITATATSTADPSLTATETPTPTFTLPPAPTDTPNPLFTETPVPTGEITSTPIPTLVPTDTPVVVFTDTPAVEVTPPAPPQGPTTEIIVKFHGIVPNFIAKQVIQSEGGQVEGDLNTSAPNVVSVPEKKSDEIISSLNDNLLVDYAEPNYAVKAFYTPNDPGFVDQDNLQQMQVPLAWDVTRGQGVVVAVIDTGVDFTHPDLLNNLWANPGEMGTDSNGNDKSTNGIDDDNDGFVDDVFGWNFVENNNDFSDGNGHGTHIAGIIAASMDNAAGIAGVAPEAKIMPLKALDANGSGTSAQVAQAIYYAVDHGANVINLGFGGTNNSDAMRDATDYAYSHGVVVIAAAGNGGSDTLYYPAANPNVIAVEALDPAHNLTSFSTYGYTYSLSAPGVGIYSTLPGAAYGHMSGTSMAAAEVSGIAALLASDPTRFGTADKIRYALLGSSLDLGADGPDPYFGYGLVQAVSALAYDPATFATPTASPAPGGVPSPTPTAGDTGVTIQGDAANANINNYTRSCPIGAVFSGLGGTAVPAVQVDDGASGAIPIGFDFWYMGTRYTNVYASSNGWLSFIDPSGNSYPDNNTPTLANPTPRPMLAPLWDDLSGVGGTATYSTSGSAPNRVFTFEWLNWRWGKSAAGAVISFRVELYESTGVVRFRYVQNTNPVSAGSASVGMTSSNTGSGNFVAVNPNTSFTTTCPTWSTASDPANIFAKPPSGKILTFTPPTPANPTNLQITATTANSATLTWTDNASNEDGYVIYTSTDGVNFTTQAGTTSGWQTPAISGTGSTATTTVTGLSNVDKLYWRVYAVTEGGLSSTPAAINPPSALTFTNFQPTSVTLNWSDSPNDAGYILLNSTNGTDFNFVTQLPANTVTYAASGLTAGTSYAWRVQAINPRAISSALQGSTPSITITAPADNSTFTQTDTITFTALATDALQGDLSSSIQWSSDIDGALGTGGTLNKTGLSLGQHTITAQVTTANGLTAAASLTIIVTDASGNVPPLLAITAPSNNSIFMQGTPVTFTGSANDLQDGNLSGNIEWRSSLNGVLGTGASISTSSLSVGTHTISARVTDSGGLTSTKSIRIYITNTGGGLPPDLAILSPANGATFMQGTDIGFLGKALIRDNGDISNYIQWSSSLDGPLASNASSFGISTLSVGTHTITATVTDANTGLNTTATITIVVTARPAPGANPHGMFNGSIDTCAACHNPHSAQSWGPLLTFADSPYENNNFCLSCHNTGTDAYSTHSNKDAQGALEQPFELLCVQCHDPHGNAPNLATIRSDPKLGSLPTTYDQMTDSGSSIIFTSLTGANSFDDGTSPTSSRLCLACHQNTSNAGAPMTLHNGGAGHSGGRDYTGVDCTACHPHSTDSNPLTKDGFTTTCRACHSQPQDAGNGTPRRQIVGFPAGSGGNDNDFARPSHHVSGNDTVTDADCLVCHDMSQHEQGKVRLINQDSPSTIYTLDYLKNGSSDPADYEAFCLSCHDSNGKSGNTTPFSDKQVVPPLNNSLWAFAQHNIVQGLFSASCLDCHSNGHGSNKANMLSQFTTSAPWDYQYTGSGNAPADVMDQEEDFCAKCHSASGPGTDIQSAFTSYTNTATRIFKHDVSATYSKHDSSEVFGSLFGGANRHAECNDCHNSHAAKTGLTLAPTLPPELRGASGVDPVYGGSGAPVSYNFLTQVTAEDQVCFKCHSSYTTLPSYSPDGWNGAAFVPNGLFKLGNSANAQVPDSRDMAKEFNPNAASFHGVLAPGKNPNMPDSFVVGSGWTSTSRMYCSSCHTSANPAADGVGPHGSPCLHLLRDAVNDASCNQYTTVWSGTAPSTNEICFACHRSDVYDASLPTTNGALTYFRNGLNQNLHATHVYNQGLSCYACHDSHGSEQLHLLNFNTLYTGFEPGYNSQSAWSATLNPNGTTATASCFISGGCHDTASYTP